MTSSNIKPVLSVRDLAVRLGNGRSLVEGINFDVQRGELLGLVGESGSGKTTVALALLGHTRSGAEISSGSIMIEDRLILDLSPTELRSVRGKLISYVPQDPQISLNPGLRIQAQLSDLARLHRPEDDSGSQVQDVLQRVQLPHDEQFRKRFPHQLSGGQLQRLAIAMALIARPPVVVFDEPTTGLDVLTQSHIVAEIGRLKETEHIASIFVSHDLATVAAVADRIAVMYAGRIVEIGPVATVFGHPRHPYTRGLLESVPDARVPRKVMGMPGTAARPGDSEGQCSFGPRCSLKTSECDDRVPDLLAINPEHSVRCIHWQKTGSLRLGEERIRQVDVADRSPVLLVQALSAQHRGPQGKITVVQNLSLEVRQGECVALVGESGSGKTTSARCIVGLHAPSEGKILLNGRELEAQASGRPKDVRRRLQIVFQNPYDSLPPRSTVKDAIGRPIELFYTLSRAEANARIASLLEQVRLPTAVGERYPSELSGGERQRVAIARALVAEPDLLVCDEVTSALDVSVQASILDLLSDLRSEVGMAMLFITHDLGVVRTLADRVIVMHHGAVREQGSVEQVLDHPSDPYTQLLLDATPHLAVRNG